MVDIKQMIIRDEDMADKQPQQTSEQELLKIEDIYRDISALLNKGRPATEVKFMLLMFGFKGPKSSQILSDWDIRHGLDVLKDFIEDFERKLKESEPSK